MKISHKLIICFMAIALLSAFPLYYTLAAYEDINLGFTRLMSDPVPNVKALEELRFAGVRIVSSASEFGFIQNELKGSEEHEGADEEETLIKSGYARFDKALARYESMAKSHEERGFLARIRSGGEKLKTTSAELVALKKNGVTGEEVLAVKEAFELEEREYLAAVDGALANEYREMEAEQSSVQSTINIATQSAIGVSALIFLAAIFMGIFASRKMAGRVERLKAASEKIGRGELNTEIEVSGGDELGNLAMSFKQMAANLETTRDQIISSRNFVDNILASMADALFVVSPDMTIARVNSAACDMTGHTEEELVGMPIANVGGSYGLLNKEELKELKERGILRGADRPFYSNTGEAIMVSTSASIMLDETGIACYVLVVQDVTQRKELEQELKYMALHDPLTKLANRDLFSDRVKHAMMLAKRRKEPLAVLFIDLDNFKLINDSMGHSAGDKLLVRVAERICGAVRESDTAARLGGDEFAVLVEQSSNRLAGEKVAQQIAEALTRVFTVDGKEVFIDASIGIAVYENGSEKADELLRNADTAMYMAKSKGKGCYVVFEDEMHTELVRRVELKTDLRRAIRDKEFFLHYHPIIDLNTGKMSGVEALVRWQHPARGLISPLDFIPIAESTGLIVELGRWILNEACRTAQAWRREYFAGGDFTLMVNLSAREFHEPSLVDSITEALLESGLPPKCLVLEITESIMLQETETMIMRLHELRKLGIRLAIDDFGTGYSSLSYLERLPVDILKIDKSFVDKVSAGTESAALAGAIITMSSTLRLQTVAEGIEHPEQVAALQNLGCEMGQGFHFTKPLGNEAMEEKLRQDFGSKDFILIPDTIQIRGEAVIG